MISNLNNQGRLAKLATLPRLYQVRVGDEPVVLLVDPQVNKLLGVVANRLTPAVDGIITKAQSGVAADDMRFRRCPMMESKLAAGFVYLAFEYADALSCDARSMMLMRSTLKPMLRYATAATVAELLEVGGI